MLDPNLDFEREFEREFSNPDNERIFLLYHNKENDRIRNFVLESLVRRFPSLSYLSKGISTQNPIEALRNMPINEIEVSEDNLDYMLVIDYLSKLKGVYVSVLRAMKEVANLNNIKPEELVINQCYIDEVTRKVFSTREKAEKFILDGYRVNKISLDIVSKTIKDSKKDGGLTEKLLEIEKAPTSEALNAYHETALEFRRNEFDRIYGSV